MSGSRGLAGWVNDRASRRSGLEPGTDSAPGDDPQLDGYARNDPRLSLGGAFLRGQTRRAVGLGGAFIWLAFIVFPVADAIGRQAPTFQHGLIVAGAVAFVVAYVMLVLSWRRRSTVAIRLGLFAVLIALSAALTLGDRPGWGFLFTYCAACAALAGPPPYGSFGVMLAAVLAGATTAINGGNGGSVVGVIASAAGIGLLMLLLRDLRVRNDELLDARAELARLAVAQERERFARDLHDLLGHTLSVIALKAELAGRLLPSRVSDAEREIAEVEQVARTALTEVRDAVSGYRRPTLDGELAGAKMALTAAGIEAEVRRDSVALEPAVEAVLAWAVREGATNVIRHSHATRCTLSVTVTLSDAAVEIVDNGVGAASRTAARGHGPDADRGHGLDGLAERARALDGVVEAGTPREGGFRLLVRIPASAGHRTVATAGPAARVADEPADAEALVPTGKAGSRDSLGS
jgi:two-component system, NarL family, sensor histidine kinase DesK